MRDSGFPLLRLLLTAITVSRYVPNCTVAYEGNSEQSKPRNPNLFDIRTVVVVVTATTPSLHQPLIALVDLDSIVNNNINNNHEGAESKDEMVLL